MKYSVSSITNDTKLMLLFCTLGLLVLFLLSQGWIVFTFICPFRYLTGIICPFCGMTRSLISLLQGDYQRSILFHLFGVILFFILGLRILKIVLELGNNRCFTSFFRIFFKDKSEKILLVFFWGYYSLRLYTLYGFGVWHDVLMQSSLGIWLQSGVEIL